MLSADPGARTVPGADPAGPPPKPAPCPEPVAQITARNRREYADLIRVRADSTLVQLTDDEFSAGMQRLEHDAASTLGDEPVVSTLDLLVLR